MTESDYTLKIYNSLHQKTESFKPLEKEQIGLYTCGPTVYDYVHIGNWRTYTLSDIIKRTLEYLGYSVKYVMNITDVGHLTGDNEGDADTGVDRMEKGAKREGRSAWEIAEFYANDFLENFDKMNLERPDFFPRPTEHIVEQINMIKKIETKGFAYKITDGLYFDTVAYEKAGFRYGELSTLDEIREGARVEKNPEKKNPRDFALWKFSPEGEKRHMEWDSPWGNGFPGWHIECSAMSIKYLGDQFDIHAGGEDLRSTHHPNEIAQSESATGKSPFVKYWVHGAFLQVDGKRMGKSLGNAYTLPDIEQKGYEPMDLRFFYLTGHYRKKLNFTWKALEGSRTARLRLFNYIKIWLQDAQKDEGFHGKIDKKFKDRFAGALGDDFNLPEVLAVIWELAKADINPESKLATLLDFDKVLGLGIEKKITDPESVSVSEEVKELLSNRQKARDGKNWGKSDEIRDLLREKYGLNVKDTDRGQEVEKM